MDSMYPTKLCIIRILSMTNCKTYNNCAYMTNIGIIIIYTDIQWIKLTEKSDSRYTNKQYGITSVSSASNKRV